MSIGEISIVESTAVIVIYKLSSANSIPVCTFKSERSRSLMRNTDQSKFYKYNRSVVQSIVLVLLLTVVQIQMHIV